MDISPEEWRPVVGLEGLYEVSSWGRVRSRPRARTKGGLLKPWFQGGRYPTVRLRKEGRRVNGMVHVLVARAFLGPPPPGQEVRHLDTDSFNCRLDNLAYGTRVENAQDGLIHGKQHNARKTHCKWGHEFTSENTRVRVKKNGGLARDCLTCERDKNRARYH